MTRLFESLCLVKITGFFGLSKCFQTLTDDWAEEDARKNLLRPSGGGTGTAARKAMRISTDVGVKVEIHEVSLLKRVGLVEFGEIGWSVTLGRPVCYVLGRVAVNNIVKIWCLRVEYWRGLVA